jgi:Flavin containing amine oxidoreductase
MSNPSSQSVMSCDVLVVGAGMAGLFAAWRLLTNNPGLNVIIVDKLNRSGGRLETTTVQITGIDGNQYTVKDEEGGMRFVPQISGGMQNLWKLIDMFNLTPVPFAMGDDNNRYYFRGQSFSFAEASANNYALWSSIFNLAPSEQGLSPVKVLVNVMQNILNQNPGGYQAGVWPDTPESWIEFRNTFTYSDSTGLPVVINKWGFWSLLRTYGLTEECINWLNQVIGFMGPFDSFINAGESLQIIFDFPAAASFFTLKNGYQSLPTALQSKALTMGAEIVFQEQISSLEASTDGVFAFGNKYTYEASNVILAIPKDGIKKITEASSLLSDNINFVNTIHSIQNMELTKVGLYFNQRWWHANQAINLSNGPSFTDLPLGSVYCFSQYPYDPNNPNDPNRILDEQYVGPAALTLYTDFIRGNFWKEMQNIGPMYQTSEFPQNPPGSYPASINLVNEVMKQIKLLFGLDENDPSVPMPVLSTYRVWGESQFGYGYHQYRLNVNDEFVYQNVWNPANNVFVCNEAWSPEQGWVEGSLIASDLVMQKGFGLSPFIPSQTKDKLKKEPIATKEKINNKTKINRF